ncbi:MAG: glutamine-hydrolyzing GMP synthase [Erysipelotrichaceae bacterium]|nr:glutamine-hydrolyzing GMP synthase [Erysipelotrichaceae bacterium]
MDKILVLDFGGQYDQLIARRVRSESVYAEIVNYDRITVEEIRKEAYKGIIFTGGPKSVYANDAPLYDGKILELGVPVLGICYGHQLMAHLLKGKIVPSGNGSEYGKTEVTISPSILFKDMPERSVCWMSHTDFVEEIPEGFSVIARTGKCACAAMADEERRLYGVQFHPEVSHTEYGQQVIRNFLFEICGCERNWQMEDFLEESIRRYRRELEGEKVMLGLSGGVDSLVSAVLLNKAIGKDLVCVLIDHGLFRENEVEEVERTVRKQFDINLIRADAKKRFLDHLKGITDPEEKRKTIGEDFVRVFEEEAEKLKNIAILAQGTIYPDLIESGKGDSATIKSHHNVGGLPKDIRFKKIVEPLSSLFKDEVRELGIKMGIPEYLVYRQPFPGPGLAVRIIGEVTEEKLKVLKRADAIFRKEMKKAGCKSDQCFAVLCEGKSVGVKGDERAYGYTVALRAVNTDDFMTAEWTRIPYEVLESSSNRICNEIKEVSRVVYDITSKPPGTIEWE